MSLQMVGALSCAALNGTLITVQHVICCPYRGSLVCSSELLQDFLTRKTNLFIISAIQQRVFPWELAAVTLDRCKDMQVVYLLVLSGSCLRSPLLQSTSRGMCTAVPHSLMVTLQLQHSLGLDLPRLMAVCITNSLTYNNISVLGIVKIVKSL